MKYLLVLAVVLVAFYIWRNNRAANVQAQADSARSAQRKAAQNAALPDAIITCRHCGVHLPSRDAVKGTLGYYCGPEHQRFAEG